MFGSNSNGCPEQNGDKMQAESFEDNLFGG